MFKFTNFKIVNTYGSDVNISYDRERCFGTRERHGAKNLVVMETRRQIIPIKIYLQEWIPGEGQRGKIPDLPCFEKVIVQHTH